MTDGAGGRDATEHAGYDEWLDALAAGEPFYLECANGHGLLPPRRICPDCGSTDLTEEPLPGTGVVETCTRVHVPTPAFEDDAPYVTAIASFGPVRVTGCVPASSGDLDAVEPGVEVTPTVATSETTGDRLVVFGLE